MGQSTWQRVFVQPGHKLHAAAPICRFVLQNDGYLQGDQAVHLAACLRAAWAQAACCCTNLQVCIAERRLLAG